MAGGLGQNLNLTDTRERRDAIPNPHTALNLPRRSLLALVPALLTACSGVDVLNATVPTDTYRLTPGVAYGPDPRQQLDVYQPMLPAGASRARPAPLVVFFYGGSWSSGERADYRFVGEALASHGVVVVVADYRLSPAVRYPVFLQDSARALAWAMAQAAAFGASPTRVFVMGHSAGAYNAAMLALDPRWLAAHGRAPSQLAGWIGLAGPYDFLPISDPQSQLAFNWPDTPASSQPMAHVSAKSPPALLLAPADDTVVDPQRSTLMLAQRLRSVGVPVESALFDRVGHATLVGSLAWVLRSRAPVLPRITAFVHAAG